MTPMPASIDAVETLLADHGYVAPRALSTVVFLSLRLGRPLFLEGEAGVGKTEIAKVLATALGRRLIRLQCYEGLDAASAVAEWNFAAQMIAIRTAEAAGGADRDRLKTELFTEDFLIERPLLAAMRPQPGGAPVLLIDELDRTDEPFEAYLLEALSDFQVTIPELGTIRAPEPPIVILTSNRTREVHDALKRRCLYHWVDYPDAARELQILAMVARGLQNKLIAAALGLSEHTVKIHLHNIITKLGVHNRTEAVALYFEHRDREGGGSSSGYVQRPGSNPASGGDA